MHTYVSVSACVVEGGLFFFKRGVTRFLSYCLMFLMCLAVVFLICFFLLNSCLNKAFTACVTHLTLLCLSLFNCKIMEMLLPLGGKSSHFQSVFCIWSRIILNDCSKCRFWNLSSGAL